MTNPISQKDLMTKFLYQFDKEILIKDGLDPEQATKESKKDLENTKELIDCMLQAMQKVGIELKLKGE